MQRIKNERENHTDIVENFELEIETLQRQIEMMNGIQEKQEIEISNLKTQIEGQDSSLKDEFNRIQEQCNQKSILADKLALDLSNIEKEKNNILEEKGMLSDRLSKTLDDFKALQDLKAELQASLESAGNAKELQDDLDLLRTETQENIQHIKGTLKTYLQNCPKTTKENEIVLTVVYSMLGFTPEETSILDAQRKEKFPMNMKAKSGKGLFGMFGGKK